ncbi:MAG: hypothetical protein IJ899_19225 [Blautia sp.]|nr:hypothetical protein [Blautia sp.]
MPKKKLLQKKEKLLLSRAQKNMRLLGIFHYLRAAMLLFLLIVFAAIGPETVWTAIQESNSSPFAYLEKYDAWVAGMSILTLVFIQMATEFFVGWGCRRNSTRPRNLLLMLILSGISSVGSLFSFITAGMTNPINCLDPAYALLINLITFLLSFRIRQQYKNQTSNP